ncbi:MAG: hypothetical protein H7Y01_12885, partial [Ferruginibacter sp.]|nr:hypothetical protein [Chitinophagaceae bacterium]
ACRGINVQVIARNSRGDELKDVPLHTMEGSDFFTQDLFDALAKGEADIAVHSLKDMSSEHFFGTNRFAVVDREDTRDVAIFNKDIELKIKKEEQIIIGTCSPRREEMAIGFLQKALPQWSKGFMVVTKNIRGNVDTRLRKLDAGEYDGIILATAGLNRLLASEQDAPLIKELLKTKKLMLLPLIECVPAPCQGAIVAEASPANEKAVEVLTTINNRRWMETCVKEKKTAMQYGAGCLQKFGVTSIMVGSATASPGEVLYAAGKDSEGKTFTKWTGLPDLQTGKRNLFSTTDFMGSFFEYEYTRDPVEINEPVVYVANYKALVQKEWTRQLQTKKVWAAGTKTWIELAKKGIWVEGCADAFGLEFLLIPWKMPLLTISKSNVAVVTNDHSTGNWQAKGWKTYSTYSLVEKHIPGIGEKINEADIIFWTSFRQYTQYRNALKKTVIHSCPYGETAEQFKTAGIEPVVFPNIKAFQQWRQISIP